VPLLECESRSGVINGVLFSTKPGAAVFNTMLVPEENPLRVKTPLSSDVVLVVFTSSAVAEMPALVIGRPAKSITRPLTSASGNSAMSSSLFARPGLLEQLSSVS